MMRKICLYLFFIIFIIMIMVTTVVLKNGEKSKNETVSVERNKMILTGADITPASGDASEND